MELQVPYFCIDTNKKRHQLFHSNDSFIKWVGQCCNTEAILAFVQQMDSCMDQCVNTMQEENEDEDENEEESEKMVEEKDHSDSEEEEVIDDLSSAPLQLTPITPPVLPAKLSVAAKQSKLIITQNAKPIVSLPLGSTTFQPAGKRPFKSTSTLQSVPPSVDKCQKNK